jgi:hypothetical protein
MNYYIQRIQVVKSWFILWHFIKHIPYDIWRNRIILSETETYMFIALIYLIMNSNSDHIPIVYILQQVIEQFIHASYEVGDRIRGSGKGLRRTFHCEPRVLKVYIP